MSGQNLDHAPGPGHAMSYTSLIAVWAGLMCLTAVTILVAKIDLGFMNVFAALSIAACKSLLVIFFFMHLKYENMVIKGMLFLCFLVLAIAIGFTFFDLAYRA